VDMTVTDDCPVWLLAGSSLHPDDKLGLHIGGYEVNGFIDDASRAKMSIGHKGGVSDPHQPSRFSIRRKRVERQCFPLLQCIGVGA